MLGKRLKSFLGRNIVRLPNRLLVKMSGGEPVVVEGRTLDPSLQYLLSKMTAQPALQEMPLADSREFIVTGANTFAVKKAKLARVEDRLIEGRDGPIPVRIYFPEGVDVQKPGLVAYHGGGWVTGNLESYDRVARTYAATANCILVSVDYRLAPESPFPAALHDCYDAWSWTQAHAAELGMDAHRIGVAGDSAGGNLAAAVCVVARERGETMPVLQLLVYPALDLRARTESYDTCGQEGFGLTRATMEWFIENYVRGEEDLLNPLVSPLLDADLGSMPTTIIATAGFDPLLDEAAHYAQRLEEAGVSVTYHCYDSLIHGYQTMAGAIDTAGKALQETTDLLRRELHRG